MANEFPLPHMEKTYHSVTTPSLAASELSSTGISCTSVQLLNWEISLKGLVTANSITAWNPPVTSPVNPRAARMKKW